MTSPVTHMRRESREGFALLVAYAASIPAANWLYGHVGTTCVPAGPCLVPVGPGGLAAPSGVWMVGLALVLRDLIQRRLGVGWAIGAIVLGRAMSATFATPSLVVASMSAFIVSEAADLAIYTPLQRRGLIVAVLASRLVGLIVYNLLFLQFAFGNLECLFGQIV